MMPNIYNIKSETEIKNNETTSLDYFGLDSSEKYN